MGRKIYTYNPKDIKIALGNHVVSGVAEDSFVQIAQVSDGVTMKTGCDGETVRSLSPDKSFNISLTVNQYSPTNEWLNNMYDEDMETGDGMFPITVKDVLGDVVFSSEAAWATKRPEWGYGRESTNRQWTIACVNGEFSM